MLYFICDVIEANWRLFASLFLLQGLIGVILFEWSWAQTARQRDGEKECNSQFPSYMRLDIHKWKRCQFYPWNFLIAVPRIIVLVTTAFSIGLVLNILFLGQPKDRPLLGWRRVFRQWYIQITCIIMLLCLGYRIDYKKRDADYTKYLGPGYKTATTRCTTQISNHVTFLDEVMWNSVQEPPSYLAASFIAKLPLGYIFTMATNCVLIDRGQSKEMLDKAVGKIIERQKTIETSELNYPPIVIFAEGTVTNNVNINKFKRGGFAGLFPVKPSTVRYHYRQVAPDYCTILGLEGGVFQVCEPVLNTVEAITYPVFTPNDYLYTVYATSIPGYEKMEKWEIYAHAVNDFMRQAGGFGYNDQPVRERVSFRDFLYGKKDEITVNGKTFYWPPRNQASSTKQD